MYYNPYLQPKDQLAKQQVAIHNAVMQIVAGKADRMPLLVSSSTTPYQRLIAIDSDRAYLNPQHPFYDLIEAYHYFDVKLFDALFNNNLYDQQKNKVKLLSPYCQLLLQCDVFINIRESIELAKEVNGLLSIKLLALEDIYWLLGALKIGSMEPAFKTAVSQYNHDTGYTDNLREYSHYVKNLFNTYSRLLVIRVDLSYQQNSSISYEDFRTDVDYFIKLIPSNPAFKDLVGYIWKLEHGNDKGYHVHLLLFYDGAKRWSDYYITQQIGELWQNDITLGRGLYFNCNTPKQKNSYLNCYLGMVHRSEQQKIECIIAQGVSYLVKIDEYLRLTKLNRRRVLGKGVIKSKK
ncbi:inovirus Gp2 family protein [Entomomonas sp. E2T0]|uniref:inovirus Gp2 family protein n=1 Tax=Entomomonas sp. E2T0 TaxID=2930213 RepID=UPI0022283645|nr:inovirus Gp2 family protein [Entomomonas sp. E2T0]UYZ84863.1 inovirus Gp2 family protein [Entomomonas sp. E2T0]